MVLLPIIGEKEPDEWVMLEFQGDIECFEQQLIGKELQVGTLGASKTVSSDNAHSNPF